MYAHVATAAAYGGIIIYKCTSRGGDLTQETYVI